MLTASGSTTSSQDTRSLAPAAGVTPAPTDGSSYRFLSDVIMARGLVTPAAMKAALQASLAGRSLTEILVDNGSMSEDDLARTLAEHHHLDHVDLETFQIDREAAGLIEPDVARRLGAVPIAFLPSGAIVVALCDPNGSTAVLELAQRTCRSIQPAVASRSQIAAVIDSMRHGPHVVGHAVEVEAHPPPVAETAHPAEYLRTPAWSPPSGGLDSHLEAAHQRVEIAELHRHDADERARAADELARIAEARATAAEERAEAADELTRLAEARTTSADERADAAQEQIRAAHEEAAAAEQRAAAAAALAGGAEARIAAAEQRAQEAHEPIRIAREQAREADHRAELAGERARVAQSRAGAAEQRAVDAQQLARSAEARASAAEERAAEAQGLISAAQEQATAAEQRVEAAQELIRVAQEHATAAEQRADAAQELVGAAHDRATAAEQRAEAAETHAEGMSSAATVAHETLARLVHACEVLEREADARGPELEALRAALAAERDERLRLESALRRPDPAAGELATIPAVVVEPEQPQADEPADEPGPALAEPAALLTSVPQPDERALAERDALAPPLTLVPELDEPSLPEPAAATSEPAADVDDEAQLAPPVAEVVAPSPAPPVPTPKRPTRRSGGLVGRLSNGKLNGPPSSTTWGGSAAARRGRR